MSQQRYNDNYNNNYGGGGGGGGGGGDYYRQGGNNNTHQSYYAESELNDDYNNQYSNTNSQYYDQDPQSYSQNSSQRYPTDPVGGAGGGNDGYGGADVSRFMMVQDDDDNASEYPGQTYNNNNQYGQSYGDPRSGYGGINKQDPHRNDQAYGYNDQQSEYGGGGGQRSSNYNQPPPQSASVYDDDPYYNQPQNNNNYQYQLGGAGDRFSDANTIRDDQSGRLPYDGNNAGSMQARNAPSGYSRDYGPSGGNQGPGGPQGYQQYPSQQQQQQQQGGRGGYGGPPPGGPAQPPPAPRGGIQTPNGSYIPVAPRGSSHPQAVFNQPPKKVVRAIENYVARFPNELSFEKGDFFYVTAETDPVYYEVVNPIQKARGNVPKDYFEGMESMAQRNAARAAAMDDIGIMKRPTVYNAPPPQQQNSPYSPQQQQPLPYPPQGGNIMSPTSAKPLPSPRPGGVTSPFNSGPTIDTSQLVILNAAVLSDVLGEDNRYYYTVSMTWGTMAQQQQQRQGQQTGYDATSPNSATFHHRSLLQRTHDDFWVLQVSLLNFFPVESGRVPGQGGRPIPRLIPFMPVPAKTVTAEQAKKVRTRLDAYLRALVELPEKNVVNSNPVRKFFDIRPTDVEVVRDGEGIAENVGDVVVSDLLEDYGGGDNAVRVGISAGPIGFPMVIADTISWESLMISVEDRLNQRIQGLSYKDETQMLIPLCGDEDLQLLFKTNKEDLIFYVN